MRKINFDQERKFDHAVEKLLKGMVGKSQEAVSLNTDAFCASLAAMLCGPTPGAFAVSCTVHPDGDTVAVVVTSASGGFPADVCGRLPSDARIWSSLMPPGLLVLAASNLVTAGAKLGLSLLLAPFPMCVAAIGDSTWPSQAGCNNPPIAGVRTKLKLLRPEAVFAVGEQNTSAVRRV